MNAKQKIHQANLNKWAALIHDQKESGLTVDKWCAREGVTKHAYNYWKRILKEEALSSVALPDIVPILPPVAAPSSYPVPYPADPSRDSRNSCNMAPVSNIAVTLGDIRIEIGPNASDDLIANIIKAVRYV